VREGESRRRKNGREAAVPRKIRRDADDMKLR